MELLQQAAFSKEVGGQPANLFTLRNASGFVAQFSNYGARWLSMWVPDRNGDWCDVLLGFDSLDKYINAGEKYHGAVVGRVCGRINNASFSLNGKVYNLIVNDVYGKPHPNHLHGGIHGFHTSVWKGMMFVDNNGDEAVSFRYHSPHGEEGYPGNLDVEVIYTLKASGTLSLECKAVSDHDTLVNLTNHAFFNLQGAAQPKSILNHRLEINAAEFIACDEELIPTGKLLSLDTLSFDFRNPKLFADSLTTDYARIRADKGFSVAYALSATNHSRLNFAARLTNTVSGIEMALYTNQPSLQLYNGYFMDGTDIGKNNTPYYASAGIALEPQGYPDAPNHPAFPSIILKRGETYLHHSEYRFTNE